MKNEITIGMNVEAVTAVEADYDYGTVLEMSDDGASALVYWKGSESRTWAPLETIRPM